MEQNRFGKESQLVYELTQQLINELTSNYDTALKNYLISGSYLIRLAKRLTFA